MTRRGLFGAAALALPANRAPVHSVRLELPGAAPELLRFEGSRPVEAGPLKLWLAPGGAGIEAYAREEATFNLEWRWEFASGRTELYSWRKRETERVELAQDTGEPGKRGIPSQLFPFVGAVEDGELFGALGECPGFWENRSQQMMDPARGVMALRTGDGSARRTMTGIWGDSSDFYRGEYDGWQHMRKGASRRFDVWTFRAPVRAGADALYAVRLASHRALAAAKGWNGSALEAILRNNAYLQIRRNLLRAEESRYIITSGVTYGWKEWASDAVMAGLGLGDAEILAEAMRGLFWDRLNYEDNAQWYLIASAVFARGGYRPNLALCRRCWEFLKDHESAEGAYLPPRLNVPTAGLGWRTYMDLFYYEDGDAPTSNQGFHCGAMAAARELGLGAGEEDFARAGRAFAAMFNGREGYFPTSARRQEVFGGDALYGAAVTFAAFGRKCLPDELVLRHCRHAMKIQSKYGLRVVSKANGDLLEKDQYGPGNPHGLAPAEAGAYVQGGSWFFCDAGTWLAGLAHGMDPREVDRLLIERIQVELANAPAFSESIHTRTGQPHGNLLYAANGLYLWLRREIRARLGQRGPDPVASAVDGWIGKRAG